MRKRILLLIALVCSVQIFVLNARSETKEEIDHYIYELANEYSICPELIQAMVETESGYKTTASNGSCKGLMQINQNIHSKRMKELGVTDITDAYSNLLVGIDLISDLYEQYEDTATVLMAYNEGNNGVKRAEKGKVSSYAEKIANRAAELEELHGKIERNI